MLYDRPRLDLSMSKIFAGALAAASAAVASSWLGVAGTVFGAVVVSIVASVGTAVYARPLERSSAVLKQTLPPRLGRAGGGTDSQLPPCDATLQLPVAAQSSTAISAPERVTATRRPIRWGNVAATAIATLALGFSLLTSFETLIGKPASSLSGAGGVSGTTLTRLVVPPDDSIDRTPTQSGQTTDGGTGATAPATSTSPDPTAPTTATPTAPTTAAPTATAPIPTDPTPDGTQSPPTSSPTTHGVTGPSSSDPT